MDGYKASLSTNTIAEIMFAQVDEQGNRYLLLDAIFDHRTDSNEVRHQDAFIVSKNGCKQRRETTKGWEILLQ